MPAREYVCSKCPNRIGTPQLFDTLLNFSARPKCACGETMYLHLTFPFALDAGHPLCKVLDVFHESDDWLDDEGRKVTFHTFLVVVEVIENRHQDFWLPYWHTVDDGPTKTRKYGQWAPFMRDSMFKSLVDQAQKKGYLTLGPIPEGTSSAAAAQ